LTLHYHLVFIGIPIPLFPFPLIRGRGIGYIREAPLPFDSPLKERGTKGRGVRGMGYVRGAPPFFNSPHELTSGWFSPV